MNCSTLSESERLSSFSSGHSDPRGFEGLKLDLRFNLALEFKSLFNLRNDSKLKLTDFMNSTSGF